MADDWGRLVWFYIAMEDDHQNLYKCLGEVVRARRKELGLSQGELAMTSGVDRAFISNIEMGLRKPSFGTVSNISSGLKLRMSSLIGRLEKKLLALSQDAALLSDATDSNPETVPSDS
jgi:transcriptional regulator with XRE-family HTH domain